MATRRIVSGLHSSRAARLPRIGSAMFFVSWFRSLKRHLPRGSRRTGITVRVLSATQFHVSHSAVFISFPSGQHSLSIRSNPSHPKFKR